MEIPRNWTFKKKEVADNFDSHVKEQLPWYSIASNMCAHLIRSYIPENGLFYDLGCSSGNISSLCSEIFKDRKAECVSIDNSEFMGDVFSGYGDFVNSDVNSYDFKEHDVSVLFLSLMFTPVKKRIGLINKLKKSLNVGGCLIIVDKIQQGKGYIGTSISRITFLNKLSQGCNPSEVMEKEMSLVGVQRPCDDSIFKGFHKWLQIGDFAGYIYEKKEKTFKELIND